MNRFLNKIIVSVITIGFISCGNNKISEVNEWGISKDSIVSYPAFYVDLHEIGSNEYRLFDPCDFTDNRNTPSVLKNPNTPILAKDIYHNNEWNLSNDTESLALLDSLISMEVSNRLFYCKIITKTYSKSDGYFTEALGAAGHQFIETYTVEFISYFDIEQCMEDEDMDTWVNILMLEFALLTNDDFDEKQMQSYINKLRKNCVNCSEKQNENLELLITKLEKEWHRLSQQTHLKRVSYNKD